MTVLSDCIHIYNNGLWIHITSGNYYISYSIEILNYDISNTITSLCPEGLGRGVTKASPM